MPRHAERRRRMAPLLVEIAREAGILGEIIEAEPPGRDAAKIRQLLCRGLRIHVDAAMASASPPKPKKP